MVAGTTSSPVRYGDIIIVVNLVDPQQRNPKDRPCVVITNSETSTPQGSQLVVAISTNVPDPLPPYYVLLPWEHSRHPKTGADKRSAVICTWIAEIDNSRILRKRGYVPNKQLSLIADTLTRLAKGEL